VWAAFAPVRARSLKVRLSRSSSLPTEHERTRTNHERDHCDHAAHAPTALDSRLVAPTDRRGGHRGGQPAHPSNRLPSVSRRSFSGLLRRYGGISSSSRRTSRRSFTISACSSRVVPSRWPRSTSSSRAPSGETPRDRARADARPRRSTPRSPGTCARLPRGTPVTNLTDDPPFLTSLPRRKRRVSRRQRDRVNLNCGSALSQQDAAHIDAG
jgi:hypothetical protein